MAEKRAAEVSAVTLGKLFNNLTKQRIYQLEKEGIVFKNSRGKFDLAKSVNGYVKYLQEQAKSRAGASSREVADEVKIEQARKYRIENEVREGQLLPKAHVEYVVLAGWQASNLALLGIPGRLAGQLATENKPAVVRKLLKDEIDRALNEGADRLQELADTKGASGAKKKTGTKRSGSVGKSKSNPAGRKRGAGAVPK